MTSRPEVITIIPEVKQKGYGRPMNVPRVGGDGNFLDRLYLITGDVDDLKTYLRSKDDSVLKEYHEKFVIFRYFKT